jgi:hypothetical protein
MYDGALSDIALTTDPFTGSRYAFGNGNPISNIELDGHMPCDAEGRCGSYKYLDTLSSNRPSTGGSTSCPDYLPGCPGFTGGGAGPGGEATYGPGNGPQQSPRLVSVSKYVDVLSNDPELSALWQAWASYVASQRGTPFPDTPEVQALAWVAICSQHSGLCPEAFVAQENRIGTIGQFLADPAAEVAILADVHGTQESTPGLRLPAALTITDRKSDMIIRGGENISAPEVEELLLGIDGVAEVAVVAAPDERLGEHAAAVLRLAPGRATPTLDQVREHLNQASLARQKWPEEIHAVDDFPRTASGKVRKYLLREDIAARRRGE